MSYERKRYTPATLGICKSTRSMRAITSPRGYTIETITHANPSQTLHTLIGTCIKEEILFLFSCNDTIIAIEVAIFFLAQKAKPYHISLYFVQGVPKK